MPMNKDLADIVPVLCFIDAVCGEADLMNSFSEDVFVFIFIDVFALIIWFDGKLHLFNGSFLGVQLLQILARSGKIWLNN